MKTLGFAVLLLSAYTGAILVAPNAGHWVVAAAILLVAVAIKFRERGVCRARVADELDQHLQGREHSRTDDLPKSAVIERLQEAESRHGQPNRVRSADQDDGESE